jgi:ribonucleoside-diphosphate reductase beta chain
MAIVLVKKRSGAIVDFDVSRIEKAIEKAYLATNIAIHKEEVAGLAKRVCEQLESFFSSERIPTVEDIQNLVEQEIAKKGDFQVAKAYILYREERAKERKRDIFKKRVQLKPYEYPELYEYVSAIRHSYWIHTEFNFVGDVWNRGE